MLLYCFNDFIVKYLRKFANFAPKLTNVTKRFIHFYQKPE